MTTEELKIVGELVAAIEGLIYGDGSEVEARVNAEAALDRAKELSV